MRVKIGLKSNKIRLYAQPVERLEEWLTDPVSSRMMEGFLKSEQVTAKSKRKMVHLLKGRFGTLGLNKYGSRWLELGWSEGDLSLREGMAQELVSLERELRQTQWGRILGHKFQLDLYKKRRSEWMTLVQTGSQSKMKQKSLFKEFYN